MATSEQEGRGSGAEGEGESKHELALGGVGCWLPPSEKENLAERGPNRTETDARDNRQKETGEEANTTGGDEEPTANWQTAELGGTHDEKLLTAHVSQS